MYLHSCDWFLPGCWKQIWKVSFSNFTLTIVDLFFFPQICSVTVDSIQKCQSIDTISFYIITSNTHNFSLVLLYKTNNGVRGSPKSAGPHHQGVMNISFWSTPKDQWTTVQKVDTKWTKNQAAAVYSRRVLLSYIWPAKAYGMKRNVFTNTYEPRIYFVLGLIWTNSSQWTRPLHCGEVQ